MLMMRLRSSLTAFDLDPALIGLAGRTPNAALGNVAVICLLSRLFAATDHPTLPDKPQNMGSANFS